jgi:hypothetical protein
MFGRSAFGRDGFGRSTVAAGETITLETAAGQVVAHGSAGLLRVGLVASAAQIVAVSGQASGRISGGATASLVAQGSTVALVTRMQSAPATVVAVAGTAPRGVVSGSAHATIVAQAATADAVLRAATSSATLTAASGALTARVKASPATAAQIVAETRPADTALRSLAVPAVAIASPGEFHPLVRIGTAAAVVVAEPQSASAGIPGTTDSLEFVAAGGALHGRVVAVPGELYLSAREHAFGRGGFGRGGDIASTLAPSRTIVAQPGRVSVSIHHAADTVQLVAQAAPADTAISMLTMAGIIAASSRPISLRPRVSVSIFD